MNIDNNYRDRAIKLDREDGLHKFSLEFFSSDKGVIYLDGNSLGKLPLRSKDRVNKVLADEWGRDLIRSWNLSWWEMPERSAKKIAQIIGARSSEVIVADSTSVNLYKLVKAALQLNPGKRKIVCEDLSFPTDLYIIQGVIDDINAGYELHLAKSKDGISVEYDELERLIDNDTALLVLSLVSYRSASMYDMKKVNDLAHRKGALVVWDLCHAAGAVQIELDRTNADMAVGCTYKYLNCGPGSPAYLYLNENLIKKSKSPIWGWFGELKPFDFSKQYRPSDSINKFKTGTSGILSMCTQEPSLEIILEAGINNIRKKNSGLTSFFIEIFDNYLKPYGFTLGSPANAADRGSHVSIKHDEAYRISKALLDPGCGKYVVITDFRPPDNLRFGFCALYNSFEEVFNTIEELINIVSNDLHLKYSSKKEDVT